MSVARILQFTSSMISTAKTVSAIAATANFSIDELRTARDHYRYGRAAELDLTTGEKNAITVALTEALEAVEREAGTPPAIIVSPRCWKPRRIGGFYANA